MKISSISKYVLPLALASAVVISIGLSAALWLNPSHYKSGDSSSSGTNIKTELNNKPMSDLYAPTQMIHTDANGSQHLLVNQSINMVGRVHENMLNYEDVGLASRKQVSAADYLKLLQRKNSYILNYPTAVPMQIVNQFVNKRFNKLPHYSINRIILPLDDSKHIYLMGDNGRFVYTLNVKKHNLAGLNAVLKTDMTRIDVSMKLFNNKPLVSLNKSQKMPQYAYLVNEQQENYYVVRMLGEAQNFSIKHKQNATIYSDQDSKQLIFYHNKDVKFVDDRPKSIPGDLNETLFDNYNQLVSSGLSMYDVKFFDYNAKNQLSTYRGYVEGFPIFDNVNSGQITMQVVDNSSIRYQFSLTTLQIPVPSGEPDVAIPSTNSVISTLKKLGYHQNRITGIELGYSWHESSKNDILATLIPTWYIHYGNSWLNYNDILNGK